MPSHRSNHWGTNVEHWFRDNTPVRFRDESGRSTRESWRDATLPDGRPVEIKATRREHSDGQPGNFKVYEAYHRRLCREDGIYGFGLYSTDPFEIERYCFVDASELGPLRWHGGGSHRDSRQAKVEIGEAFGTEPASLRSALPALAVAGVGAVAGGVLLGPVGAVVAGAVGAVIGATVAGDRA